MLKFILILLFLVSFTAISAQGAVPKQPETLFTVSNTKELLAAAKSAAKVGGTIVLKPGSYIIDKPIVFDKVNMVNIVGSGWNSQITRKGEGDAIVFKESGFCAVKNLLLNGDKDAKTGSGIVFAPGCSSSVVDNCRICMFPESGVRFDGDDKGAQSSNTVRNCHFINNGGDQLRSYQNNDFYIIGNQFGHDQWGRGARPRSGCLLENSSAGTYSENYHWGNVNAFKMISCNFNRVENNRFEMSSESGIVIGSDAPWSGGAYNIFLGNTIHTNSEGGLGVYPAVTAKNASVYQFCTNQILSWDSNSTKHKNGLVLNAGCSKWIIKDNIIHHSTEKPLIYEENGGHIVKDNIVD
ncbi:MAG: right-handed parallel beta-helix repeat-containing protein [Armatimonadota bacterium]